MDNPKSYGNSEYVSDFESDTRSELDARSLPRTDDFDTASQLGYKRDCIGRHCEVPRPAPPKPKHPGSRVIAEDAFQRHKKLVNDYLQYYGGSRKDFHRDISKDKRDIDVIREHSRFMWTEADVPRTWEERLAKRYWDRLFKEYCMADLSRYKENKLGLRWRSEKEVVSGKGQFVCGALNCHENAFLRSWEVNFAYRERDGTRRNALVKLRLCPACSAKLNYHKQYTECVVAAQQPKVRDGGGEGEVGLKPAKRFQPDEGKQQNHLAGAKENQGVEEDRSVWSSTEPAATSREPDEFADYFKDMFL
uniref:Protein FRA10AC1 homolog n=1 Tax=Schistocephalus solidus TaxID=70667 RepID=A0A0X3P7I3_SCHSO